MPIARHIATAALGLFLGTLLFLAITIGSVLAAASLP